MAIEYIHKLLADWAPVVVGLLSKYGYFKSDHDERQELSLSLGASFWSSLAASSDRKNAALWPIVLKEISGPAAILGAMEASKAMGSRLGESATRKAYEKVGLSYISRNSSRYKMLTKTDVSRMKGYVWEYRNVGEKEFARTLQKETYVFDANVSRLKTIKRTETQHATASGYHGFAGQAGAVAKRRMTANDRRVRPSHSSDASAGWIPWEESYPSTGEMYPGQNSINCRCTEEISFDRSVLR